MINFKGKVVVITGGASGIGRGLAFGFAKRGMKIVLADIDKENLDKVAKELEEFGTEVMTQITDVSDPEQVAHLAEVSYEHFGSVNILCNNAGVGGGGPIRVLTHENWNWTLDVNLFGVIYGIQYFLNRMLETKEPCHIVNISSMSGLLSGANTQPYPASKFAVVSISESLAVECFNTNVGVSVVCPGFVNTNIIENTRILSQKRPGLWQPTSEMIKQSEPLRKNAEKISTLGMAPEKLAEIVIKAIEKDILYVLTHPEYIPLIKSRFELIYDNTLNLYEGIEGKGELESKIFKNDTPVFSLTYPADLIELIPNPFIFRVFKPVLVASRIPGFDLLIFVFKSSTYRLEKTAQRIAKRIKRRASEVNIISNEPITLRDGTFAYESVIEFKSAGIFKVKSIHLSVIKDDHRIRISIFTNANYYNEDLREILHSLEFN
ncbi:MAG: SDR family NAD(P)-dependent oxidoreductase [Candidatus Hodarchaeota archaeon]